MEQRDLDFIQEHAGSDADLKSLWEDHILLSRQVDMLESKPYRTPTEDQTLRHLKKRKLDAKTRLADRVDALRAASGN